MSQYIHLSLSRLMLLVFLLVPHLSLAADKVVLQLKWKHQFQFAGYYAAQSQGYFASEGLDVDIREIDKGLIPLDTVLSGKAQFGISDSSLVLARMQGKKPVVLATIFQHSPLVLLTLKSSGIINPLELKGKRIMFSRDIDDAVLTAMFTEVGLSSSDYEQVPQTFKDDDLINQNIDAMSAYITDQAFSLPQKNIPINIISPANYGIDFYGDMLFVEESYFENNKQQV
ncbi:MAG: ABC transporter substrate-binding protein, partial [Glaciecola sp.]